MAPVENGVAAAGLGQRLVRFASPITDEQMRDLVKRGREVAGGVVGADPRAATAAVLVEVISWDGNYRGPVPPDRFVDRIRRRLRGKQLRDLPGTAGIAAPPTACMLLAVAASAAAA